MNAFGMQNAMNQQQPPSGGFRNLYGVIGNIFIIEVDFKAFFISLRLLWIYYTF